MPQCDVETYPNNIEFASDCQCPQQAQPDSSLPMLELQQCWHTTKQLIRIAPDTYLPPLTSLLCKCFAPVATAKHDRTPLAPLQTVLNGSNTGSDITR